MSSISSRLHFWRLQSRRQRRSGCGTFLASAQHLRQWEERRQAIAAAADKAGRSDRSRQRTFEFESASGVYTELQCVSYIFMDADYGRNLDRDGAPTKAFEPSLLVWATVMSRPTEDRAIVDAGLKALAFDSGPPLVFDEPAATYERASDEHRRLASRPPPTGSGWATRSNPLHCDPTVNLYD